MFRRAASRLRDGANRLLDQAGLRMPVEDSYIASTARRYGLTIVTGNDRDFRRPRLKVFNPFKELP
jgi:predicted nucleic acid-binding protein